MFQKQRSNICIMILNSEEMRALHIARNEERACRSKVMLKSQAILDWFTRDVCARSADLFFAGGDPVLWAVAIERAMRAGRARRIVIAPTPDFSGAPLGCLRDEEHHSQLLSNGVYLPDMSDFKDWCEDLAARLAAINGQVLICADPVRVYHVKRGFACILDRPGPTQRLPIHFKRAGFGVDIASDQAGNGSRFFAQSEALYTRLRLDFSSAFGPVLKGFPAGRRYGDVVIASRMILAQEDGRHIWVDRGANAEQFMHLEFSVSRSETISSAVEAWSHDAKRVVQGFRSD